MNDIFLIDTSVWVKCLRGTDTSLQNKISTLIMEKKVYTSEIIIMEILRGAKTDKEYDILYKDFLALPQLTINYNVWKTAWKTAYKLRKSGINIPMVDVIISAAAIYYQCTIMHSDKHFNLLTKYFSLNAIEV